MGLLAYPIKPSVFGYVPECFNSAMQYYTDKNCKVHNMLSDILFLLQYGL